MTEPLTLITGATGFVGSHLVASLRTQDRQVRCLVRWSSPQEATDFLRGLGAELFEGDLADRASLDAAVDGVATVLHLGGGGRIGMPEELSRRINVEGTRNLLEACVARGDFERFVHVSTCAVMGDVGDPPGDETTPYHPENMAYARAKTAAEQLAHSYADRLPLLVVRFPGVIGAPLMRLPAEQVGGVVPLVGMLLPLKQGRWRTIGNGRNLFHTVAVDDAVRGLELAAERGRPGEIYIIAGEQAVPIDELIALAATALDVPVPTGHIPRAAAWAIALASELRARLTSRTPQLTREAVRGFTGTLAVDASKARRELGYRPQTSLDLAVREAVAWYEQNGYLNGPHPTPPA